MKVEKEKIIKVLDDCQDRLIDFRDGLLLSNKKISDISYVIGQIDAVKFIIQETDLE